MILALFILLAAAAGGSEIRIDPGTSRATVIVFISAQCPVSNAYNDRMSALFRDYWRSSSA